MRHLSCARAVPLLGLLAACETPRPAPIVRDTTPHTVVPAVLAFVSPHAGDTLVEGRTYTIRWTTPPGMRVNLGAAMGGKDKGMLLTNARLGLDTLAWTVPPGFVTGFGPPSSDAVRLRLENADISSEWVEVGPFTVRGAQGE